MTFTNTSIELAYELDAQDELATFRNEFVIHDPNLIYLDGNSLGRLPKRTINYMRQATEQEWGQRLIRVWNDGWVNTPSELGAKIAQLVGAQPDEIIVCEATSINLFKLAIAALQAKPDRIKIVSDTFNFPSDLYILQGIIELLGNRHQLELIPSEDNITVEPQAISQAIDQNTALVTLSHVTFKSAFMYDMAEVTHQAHQAGALTLWDLSHSAGAVSVDLNGAKADLAVGCTYKYLNGGPGAPAFLYVRKDLQDQLVQPMWGWFAHENPFAFNLEYSLAPDIARYRVGTPPMLSMKAVEPAVDILLEAGMDRLRAKSLHQTEYLMFLAKKQLVPLGYTIGTPPQAELRGSHVSIRHPEAYQINQALLKAKPPTRTVIPDFREPDNIRLGIAPLYNTFTEIHHAIERLRTILEDQTHLHFSPKRSGVT